MRYGNKRTITVYRTFSGAHPVYRSKRITINTNEYKYSIEQKTKERKEMKLSDEIKSTVKTKNLFGGKKQDIITYTRTDLETGIDIVTRITYGKPY